MTIEQCYAAIGGSYAEVSRRLPGQHLVEKFCRKFPDDQSYAELIAAAAAGDRDTAFRAAHTLKGVAANLAFTELQAKVSALTEQLRPQTAQADAALLAEVEKAYALVVDTINAYKAEK